MKICNNEHIIVTRGSYSTKITNLTTHLRRLSGLETTLSADHANLLVRRFYLGRHQRRIRRARYQHRILARDLLRISKLRLRERV